MATDRGLEPIETITKDRRVCAYDVWTGTWRLDTVVETFSRDYAGTIVTLEVGGETIECTARHPFWVVAGRDLDSRPLTRELGDDNHVPPGSGRWAEAQYVRGGDVLLSRESGETPVESVTTRQATLPVYNLQIAESRTYAVGSSIVLVHNQSPCDVDDLIPPSRQKHILEGDAEGGGHRSGTGRPDKTEFPPSWSDDEILEAVADIATDPNVAAIQQTGRGMGTIRSNANVPRSITTRRGRPAKYKLVKNHNGVDIVVIIEPGGREIVTAFPDWPNASSEVVRNPP